MFNNLFLFTRFQKFIEKIWKIIEKERIEGYEHRASKKRSPSIDKTEHVGSLIQLNEDSM